MGRPHAVRTVPRSSTSGNVLSLIRGFAGSVSRYRDVDRRGSAVLYEGALERRRSGEAGSFSSPDHFFFPNSYS